MKPSLLFVILIFYCGSPNSLAQNRSKLIPDFAVIQYAGSIGFTSIGVGYDLNKKIRGSLHYGFVPENKGGDLHILSTKFLYAPWVIKPNTKFQIQPIDFGVMATYHFGENFYNRWPKRYPENYYWWSSSLRFHLLMESSFTYSIPNHNSFFKSVAGYIEFNTNDLYLVSFGQNYRSINFFAIIKSGLGVRVNF